MTNILDAFNNLVQQSSTTGTSFSLGKDALTDLVDEISDSEVDEPEPSDDNTSDESVDTQSETDDGTPVDLGYDSDEWVG